MNKQEQIKEIAEMCCYLCEFELGGKCTNDGVSRGMCYMVNHVAERLYNIGYRKQSEGRWLLIKVPTGVEAFGIREVRAYHKCSICGYMGDMSEWHFKHCPNCGAKMSRKEDEGK